MNPINGLLALISGSKLIWKVVSNWRVLTNSIGGISDTLKKMHDEGRALPNAEETSLMLLCGSNILKTGIIDIPGIDEYELSLNLDKFSSSLIMSIKDSKSNKFHQIPLVKGKKDV